jgi:hypothetical protein
MTAENERRTAVRLYKDKIITSLSPSLQGEGFRVGHLEQTSLYMFHLVGVFDLPDDKFKFLNKVVCINYR